MTIYKPSISIVLPTIGRDGLWPALDHIVGAGLTSKDEIICMVDGGNQPEVTDAILEKFRNTPYIVRPFMMSGQGGDYGHPGRNRGMYLANKDLVMFTQDDQFLVPGALTVIKEVLGALTDWDTTGHMFQVVPRAGNLCFFTTGETRCGHIDADCVVLPVKRRTEFGVWKPGYNGDHSFITETMQKFGQPGFRYHHCLISVHQAHVERYKEMFPNEQP